MIQVIELAEYQAKCVPAPGPTPGDTDLAAELGAGGDVEARLDVRWLANGKIDVRASSWVGVVRFSAVEIRVLPKLVGGELKVLQMIEYTDRIDLLKRLPPEQRLAPTGDDLFELIVRLLTAETKQLLRDGLIRDYRPTEETLPMMRGRLRVRDQFLRRYGSLHQLDCAFDEYDGDIPENQFLGAALGAASNRVRNSKIKADARALHGVLSGICEPRSFDATWYTGRIHYDRRNSRYRSAHQLAQLILKGLALNDVHSGSDRGINAFMLNMNSIFEQFVAAIITNALAGTSLQVSTQVPLKAVVVNEATNRTYSTIRPDMVITDPLTGHRVPVDVKYKLYESVKLAPGDVYQLFTYAYALGSTADHRRAGLIYAADSNASGPNLSITPMSNVTSAQIRTAGLNVAAVLDDLAGGSVEDVHARMRNMVHDLSGLTFN
ncbi:MAG: McrC family protein [Fimbriimonadaceae bacterium]|nr:McrC family protein [Fimbriimonadaceae bacterium]